MPIGPALQNASAGSVVRTSIYVDEWIKWIKVEEFTNSVVPGTDVPMENPIVVPLIRLCTGAQSYEQGCQMQ